MARRALLRLGAGIPAFLGAGCGSLLPQPGQPPQLYVLRWSAAAPADLPPIAQQLLVGLPSASAGLDTERIALSRSPLGLDYFANAAWTDHAPAMVQSVLVEAFEATGKVVGVARDSGALRADYLLMSELRRFEAVYEATSPAPTVTASLVLHLVRMPDRIIIGEHASERTVGASQNGTPEIVAAFAQASNDLAADAAAWTLRRIKADAATGGRRAPQS
ncbi:MAG: membrane integrity-associated transporter subunit PqiC [Alphaproteobacteria bacterium]|nr:membrane integrity-associated transporter subunit PqiC [Alphaproteobacteria bacterium]